MPIRTKKCRVCGKEYEACHTATSPIGSFRWQEVACSPACGAKYLERILASRAGKAAEQAAVSTAEAIADVVDSDYEVEVSVEASADFEIEDNQIEPEESSDETERPWRNRRGKK